jgi:glycosyltransferase involved in cell wall biosynthesis
MPLRVLLFSPVAPFDPPSGDLAYTDALLTEPPPGVEYVTYPEALAAGTVKVRGRRPRNGGRQLVDRTLLVVRSSEWLMRRSKQMFREPCWFISISPKAFDVVHQHLFPIRQVGPRIPVVSSAGYPLTVRYQDHDGWGADRAARAEALERLYARALDIHNPWLRGVHGSVMTVYTRHFQERLIEQGTAAAAIEVIGTALPALKLPAPRSDGRTLGFVGRDFIRKGGDLALQAFQLLQARQPSLKLRVVTSKCHADAIPSDHPGVTVALDESREQLLRDHLPEIDLLLLPTRSDCGAPYALIEALQAGIPAVTSNNPWLDERLSAPAVRRVAGDPLEIATAAEQMLAPSTLQAARGAARELWQSAFSMRSVHDELLGAYDRAMHEKP